MAAVNFRHIVQGPHLASVREGLEESKAGRLLFLWYEDMKADLPNAIRWDQFSAVKLQCGISNRPPPPTQKKHPVIFDII